MKLLGIYLPKSEVVSPSLFRSNNENLITSMSPLAMSSFLQKLYYIFWHTAGSNSGKFPLPNSVMAKIWQGDYFSYQSWNLGKSHHKFVNMCNIWAKWDIWSIILQFINAMYFTANHWTLGMIFFSTNTHTLSKDTINTHTSLVALAMIVQCNK